MEFYQLKITRKGTKPPIWRRCLVPSNITFSQMAVVLEEILEYETSSLYEFEFFRKKYMFGNGQKAAKPLQTGSMISEVRQIRL